MSMDEKVKSGYDLTVESSQAFSRIYRNKKAHPVRIDVYSPPSSHGTIRKKWLILNSPLSTEAEECVINKDQAKEVSRYLEYPIGGIINGCEPVTVKIVDLLGENEIPSYLDSLKRRLRQTSLIAKGTGYITKIIDDVLYVQLTDIGPTAEYNGIYLLSKSDVRKADRELIKLGATFNWQYIHEHDIGRRFQVRFKRIKPLTEDERAEAKKKAADWLSLDDKF